MSVIQVTTPLTDEVVRALKVGDQVALSGVVYGARDAAHKRMIATLDVGGDLPVPLEGQVIYYVGPAPARPGDVIGSAGPTTSSRMDSFTPALLARGLKGIIGKGSRSEAVKELLKRYNALYLVAVGGAAALIAARIKQVDVVAYEDLGTEAIHRMVVEDFPLVVANDAHGGDLYEQGKQAWRRGE